MNEFDSFMLAVTLMMCMMGIVAILTSIRDWIVTKIRIRKGVCITCGTRKPEDDKYNCKACIDNWVCEMLSL